MSGPPSRTDSRGWHNLIEHYTPDGTLGRLLFGTVFGLGLGTFLFFAGIAQVTGPVSAFLLSELVGLISIPVGAALLAISVVVLWPVYLSLIGNLDSTSDYDGAGNARRVTSTTTSRPNVRGNEANPIELLEDLYSTGEISREAFERRIDDVVDGDTRRRRSNRDAVDTGIESEVE